MPVTIRPFCPDEEEYVASAHQRVYAVEYHWGPAFSDYAMKIARDFAAQPHTEREGLWVAESDGKLIGSVMLCNTDENTVGQLRLFLVEKDYRCKGVGTALLNTSLEQARTVGYQKLVLWTASPLTDAIRQYEKLGFRETQRTENTTWSLDGETVFEIKMEMGFC